MHFSPNYFNSKQRQKTRSQTHHEQTVYSLATQHIAEKHGRNFELADQLVKAHFSLLKITDDKPEFDTDTKRRVPRKKNGQIALYTNLFEHFFQAYVNTYGKLFAQGGMTRNFNFCVNKNPLLSTSKNAFPASYFAGGHFITSNIRYLPSLSNKGGLKHRRLGYVQVYYVPKEYYEKFAIDVPNLIDNSTIGVDAHHAHASEVAFQSSLPKECVVGYQIIALPKMRNSWTQEVQEKYGLNPSEYNHFRAHLGDSNQLKNLIEKVVTFQANILCKHMEKLMKDFQDIQKLTQSMASVNTGDIKSFSSLPSAENIQMVLGPFHLKWSNNSCYLDSVLQALFLIEWC